MLTTENRIYDKKDLHVFLEKEVIEKGILGHFKRLFTLTERSIIDKHQIFLRKCEY